MQKEPGLEQLCEDIRENVPAVMQEWEVLVHRQPWYSLPREHRIDNLPDVVVGLVESSLCSPRDIEAHRLKIAAAVEHGSQRRAQGIPESMLLTEYHLLRQAIWNYLIGKFGPGDAQVTAIMRIDAACTVATNASMWGYHRMEIEALGKWDEGMDRIVTSSPLLA